MSYLHDYSYVTLKGCGAAFDDVGLLTELRDYICARDSHEVSSEYERIALQAMKQVLEDFLESKGVSYDAAYHFAIGRRIYNSEEHRAACLAAVTRGDAPPTSLQWDMRR